MDGRVSYFENIFILFMKMLLKITLKTPTKTIFEAVLCMYLLTNTNYAVIFFFITRHVIVPLIMDMESAKSDVNGPKTKI